MRFFTPLKGKWGKRTSFLGYLASAQLSEQSIASWEQRQYVRCTTEPAHFCIILWPQLQGRMEVDRAWDSCKAHCYVVNACWNSQINGRGSSPNQGSISGYILVLWAVVHPGRHQYLPLPWHSDRQKRKKGGWQPFWYLSLRGWPYTRKSPFLWHHLGIAVS